MEHRVDGQTAEDEHGGEGDYPRPTRELLSCAKPDCEDYARARRAVARQTRADERQDRRRNLATYQASSRWSKANGHLCSLSSGAPVVTVDSRRAPQLLGSARRRASACRCAASAPRWPRKAIKTSAESLTIRSRSATCLMRNDLAEALLQADGLGLA